MSAVSMFIWKVLKNVHYYAALLSSGKYLGSGESALITTVFTNIVGMLFDGRK